MEKKFNQWIQLLRCTELSGNERIVLALILNYHNNENWDNTSIRTLKKDSGLTAPTIAKCVKVLEDKGLIKTVISTYKKNINATNDYLPNYETIQQMIDKYNSNCVLGMKETCIRDTEGMKEICGIKETYIPYEIYTFHFIFLPAVQFSLRSDSGGGSGSARQGQGVFQCWQGG